jgi:hypothetical protein
MLRPFARRAALAAVAVLLASCASQSAAPFPRTLDGVAAKKVKSLLFVADEGSQSRSGFIYAYDAAGSAQTPLWTLTGSPLRYPAGLWVDGAGDLYVADQGGAVYMYVTPGAASPPGQPSMTYNDAGYSPIATATCGGYVYAANAAGAQHVATFTIWQKGTSTPYKVVSSSHYGSGSTGQGITCDAKTGTVYFGYDVADNGPGAVDAWAPDGTGTATTLPVYPQEVSGFARNKAGVLAVGDAYDVRGPAIEFYKTTGQLTHAIVASWLATPVAVAFDGGDDAVWIADVAAKAVYRASAGKGALLDTITAPGFLSLSGVAVNPPDHP